MVYLNHDATLDGSTQLKDAGLVAATAVTQVGGADVTIDLGAAKFCKGKILVDVTACEVASTDEAYKIQLQGSTTSNFSTAYQLAVTLLGDSSTTGNAVDTAPVGRHVIYFDNIAHTSATTDEPIPVRYLRLRTVVAGTVATGINYVAWMVPDGE